MRQIHLRRSDPTVDRIVKAAFPAFTGKRVVAVIQESARLYGTLWDEGSKRDYVFVNVQTLARMSVPQAPFAERSAMYENNIKIPPGLVLVVLDRFGKRQHIEIITPPGNITPLLPSSIECSEDEQIVLAATKSRKASYGGIPNYRFSEANRYRGITLERWNAAKASLIEKGLLTRAGALTPEGKNVTTPRLENYT